MKFSLFLPVLLTLAVTATTFAQESKLQNPLGITIPGVAMDGTDTSDLTGQEQESQFPQSESDDGPNQLIPGGTDDNQQIFAGEGEGGNVERPKRLFWPVARNNHYYYNYDHGHHHHHYRRYCRHYHRHCYNSPYYHCENICDNWGYYYY